MHITCCTLYIRSFFNLDKLLMLLSSAVSTQDKKTVILSLGFSPLVTSEHGKKNEEQRARMKANTAAPGSRHGVLSSPGCPSALTPSGLTWLCYEHSLGFASRAV